MIVESIILAIFVCSFGGVLLILIRKVPILSALPQNGTTGLKKNNIIFKIGDRAKEFFVFFEKQILLHKLLSWIKVVTLKIETKVDNSLRNIRKKAQQSDKPK